MYIYIIYIYIYLDLPKGAFMDDKGCPYTIFFWTQTALLGRCWYTYIIDNLFQVIPRMLDRDDPTFPEMIQPFQRWIQSANFVKPFQMDGFFLSGSQWCWEDWQDIPVVFCQSDHFKWYDLFIYLGIDVYSFVLCIYIYLYLLVICFHD